MDSRRHLHESMEGDDVARLHHALASAGFEVEDAEREARRFGHSTAEAVRRVQSLCGFEPTGVVDEKTWAVVVVIIEKITVKKGDHEHEDEDEHHKHHGHGGDGGEGEGGGGGGGGGGDSRYKVSGLVSDVDGNPFVGAEVVAYDVALRERKELGRAKTDDRGDYAIPYGGPLFPHDGIKAADLQMDVLDARGTVLLSSAILFHAPRQAVINLPIAGPNLGQPSEYTNMQTTIAMSLGTLAPTDLVENPTHHDLTFLAGETGFPEARIALYAIACRLSAAHAPLPPELFYGLFRLGIPADATGSALSATLAGVDLAGNGDRLLSSVLSASATVRAQAVASAIAANIIPASYASRSSADLELLTSMAGDAALQSPHGMGKTPIGEVLTAANVAPDKQKAFITTFVTATGPTRAFWKGLYTDPRFTKAEVANLRFATNIGRFTKGHLPLVNALVAMRTSGEIKGSRDLARLSRDQWRTMLQSTPGAHAVRVPANFTASSPTATIDAYARLLERNFERAHPTTAFSARLAEDTASPLAAQAAVSTFIDANPRFNLLRTHVDRFLKDNPPSPGTAAPDPALRASLLTSQRVLKVASRYAVAKPLLASNLRSAGQIYAMGKSQFVAKYATNPDIGKALATQVFAKAEQTYATAMALAFNTNSTFLGPGPLSVGTVNPGSVAPPLQAFPNLQTLFGSLDYCQCDDCLSVLSPAAYLVDLLYYLGHRKNTAGKSAQSVLLLRRPDIVQILLNCPNNKVRIPYIDLVNELLESVVAPGDPMANPLVRQTTLTTPELNANPQYTNPTAYVTLNAAVYPWILPLDLPLTEARVYLRQVSVTRAALMTLFQPPIALPSPQANSVAIEFLGSSPHEADIITGGPLASGETSWGYWGLDQTTNTVQDPAVQTIVVTGTWLDVLAHVRILLARARLSYLELSRLFNTWFINGDRSLSIQSNPPDSCDLGAMTLVGRRNEDAPAPAALRINSASIDRLHRFTRLWRRIGWDVYDLDSAIKAVRPSGAPVLALLDMPLLRLLAAIKTAAAKYGLSVSQAAAFFGEIDTRVVPTLPGDDPHPSLYAQLFQNLAVLNPVDPIFILNFDGSEIAAIGSAPKLTDHRASLASAFQVVDADLGLAIAAFTDGSLTLANLGALYRNLTQAGVLGLSVADYVSLRAMIEVPSTTAAGFEAVNPFDPTRPERLAIFADLAGLVGRSGFSVASLDYLLRDVVDPGSGLLPDDPTVGTLLKSLRDGLQKVAVQTTFAPDPAGVETRRRLAEFLSPANVDTAMGILAGTSPLNAADQSAFVTATLQPALNDPTTLASLVGAGALKAGPPRFEFVLKHLLIALRRSQGVGLVVHDLGVALGLPSTTAAFVLNTWFTSTADPTKPLINDFLALPKIARIPSVADQPIMRTEAGFASYFTSYEALDKAAAMIGGFALTADETTWLHDAGVGLGWLDPTKLPTAAQPDAAGLFVAWSRLATYVAHRNALPTAPTAPTALFDLARNGANKATYLAALASRTRWALPDLLILCGDPAKPIDAGAIGLVYPDDYRSEVALSRLKPAFDYLTSKGIPSAASGWTAPDVTPDQADAIKKAVKAKYSNDIWPSIAKPLRDTLREAQRDALVAYLLAEPPPVPGIPWRDPDDLYAYYLIDVSMGACGSTSRVVQASATVQLFVQRCFLNLESSVLVDAGVDADWLQWQWMSLYRVWEANREVFLYPENWIDPTLRLDKSPFFKDLENDLLQGDMSKESTRTAFLSYLEKLGGVARLDVCGMYHDSSKGSDLLHVLARTQGTPATYYYRQWVDASRWTAWTKVDLDITSEHVLPIVWNNRLYAFWAIVTTKADKKQAKPLPTPNTTTPPPDPKTHLEIQLAWSEFKGTKWQAKQVAPQTIVAQNSSGEFQPFDITLKSSVSGDTLQIDVFSTLKAGRIHMAQYRLGGVGNSVEAFVMVAYFTSLGDVGPATANIGQLPIASFLGEIPPPSQSIFDANTIGPNPTALSQYTPSRSRVGPLNTTYQNYKTLSSEVVLQRADWYRLLVPHQTLNFDSSIPFFHRDSGRQYFVIPSIYYQNGNYFTTNAPNYVYHPFYRAEYRFQPFYHAFVPLFIRELNRGGVDALFNRQLQLDPASITGRGGFDFHDYYQPTDLVLRPFPTEGVDFDFEAGYAIYNWELFFHAPLLIANALSRNQKFDHARNWYQYIFDPTSRTKDQAPQRYWVTKPFYQMTAADYAAQQVASLLKSLNSHDPTVEHEVAEWRKNPFDPHVIAQLRPVAYQRTTVMRSIDNLLAQGDNLFMQYTLESVNEARQYYVMASDLLGPRPVQLPPRDKPAMTYQDLEKAGLDGFADAVVAAENAQPRIRVNVSVDPSTPKLPLLPTFYFCLPPNPQLLAYWDKVADRLFKIRHCMNIKGVVVPLPLLAPPIDPGLLVRALVGGLDLASALSDIGAATPPYRYMTVVRQALNLADEVRSLGGELLSALEKRDAEQLAMIRSTSERSLQNAIFTLRARQIDEADAQLDVLAKNRLAVKERGDFYNNISFMNTWETTTMTLKALTLIPDAISAILEATAGTVHVIPDITVGANGFGGTPSVVVKIGGSSFGHAASGWATASRIASSMLHTGAELASIYGGYQRRMDDWGLQGRVANLDLNRIDSESAAAGIRKDLAKLELANHGITVQESIDVDDFLHGKYTNQALYDWMVGQISTVYFQAYQLAFTVAKQAEQCFRRELSVDETGFVTFGYWDSLKKGLLAAERLSFDLRRMESAYIAQHARELEITRHVSLVSLDPYALVELQTTGSCTITLPELFFDLDNPGHYLRKLKSVAVTVPCVVGPYGGVSMTLTLLDNHVRTTTDTTPGYARPPGDDLRFRDDPGGTQAIVTSSGQNDSGLFETNLNDERYLPFEGSGAVATWSLRLNPIYPQFDRSTVTDVVLHLRYTARDGGAAFAMTASDQAKKTLNQIALAESRRGLFRLVSARHDAGTNWARFLNPGPGVDQVLAIDTPADRFPFFTNGLDVKISGIDVIASMDDPADYSMVITPPGGTPRTVTLAADPTLGGAHHWSLHPLAPKVNLGKAPSTKPYPSWSIKIQKPGAADFRSLPPGAINDLFLILQYEVS